MGFDFTSIMDRAGHDAIAVDAIGSGGMAPGAPGASFDVIPMWVADMNFPTCPAVTRAIVERAQHLAFGYYAPSKAFYRVVIDWQRERNGARGLEAHHIGYENGVLGGVVSAPRPPRATTTA